jgi:hypothetical protein
MKEKNDRWHFSFQNQFLAIIKGKLIDGNFFLQINYISEGYNVMHLDFSV